MEGKLLRSARRFAKPFVGKPMGIVSSAFRMKLEKIDYIMTAFIVLFWATLGIYIFVVTAPIDIIVMQTILSAGWTAWCFHCWYEL